MQHDLSIHCGALVTEDSLVHVHVVASESLVMACAEKHNHDQVDYSVALVVLLASWSLVGEVRLNPYASSVVLAAAGSWSLVCEARLNPYASSVTLAAACPLVLHAARDVVARPLWL